MKNLKSLILSSVLGIFVLMSYNNCGKKVVFAVPYGSETVSRVCANSGKLQKVTFTVNIPNPLATNGTCPWPLSGEDSAGNLPRLNGKLTSRIEQKFPLAQFSGKIICDLNLSSAPDTNFYYDDSIMLTLNDKILASSMDADPNVFNHYDTLPNDPDIPIYDWVKLRDSVRTAHSPMDFCLGGVFSPVENSTEEYFCHWPPTETQGKMVFNFNPTKIQNIIAATRPGEEFYLKFVTTGDNDDTLDCRHSDMKVLVEAYIGTP